MSYSTRNRPTPTGHGLLRTASVVLVAVTWVITQSQSLSAQSSRLRPLARNRTTQESGTQNPLPKAQPATKTSDQGNSKSAEVAKPTEDPPITVATQEEKNQKIAEDWEDPWLVFYITGNQYGYLEPCGCTGLENQKGGINRKDTLLSSLRKRGWQILPLDAGDQVRRDGTQSEIKFHWTTQALRQMDYAATTFGGKDLMLSDNILVSILDENGNNKLFVSANVGMLPDFDLPFKVVTVQGPDRQPRKIGITGIVGEENLKAYLARNQGFFTVNPPIPAAQEIATKLEAEGCDYKILLVSATIEETRKIVQAVPKFDLVITTGGLGEPTFRPEILPGVKSEIVQAGTKGMYAGIIGLFNNPNQKTRYQRIALSSQFEDSQRMLELFGKYQDELKAKADDHFSSLGLRPVNHPSSHEFVGSEKCGECHTTAFDIWRKTPHAHATDSIVSPPERSIARHFDPECISCHVTGWNPQKVFPYRTGYDTLEASVHLHGNGCENCHGPGSEHVTAELDANADRKLLEQLRASMQLPLAKAQDKCLECHDIDNSPAFHKTGAFETYWEKVKHIGKD